MKPFCGSISNDDVGVVQQHPVLGVVALGAVGLQTLLRELELHLIGQRSHLGGGGAGGDDEVIGEDGQALHLEHPHIPGEAWRRSSNEAETSDEESRNQ